MRNFSVLLALLASVPAFAVDVTTINEESGCSRGKAQEMAKKQCADFDVAGLRNRDDSIKNAYNKCLAFYESALRVQNTFCSYRMDAVIFQVISESTAGAPDAGLANVSEEKVAKDNEDVSKITKAYIDRFTALAPKFRDAYQNYEAAIGKMNGGGGTDEFYESACSASMVQGQVPGYLRELLATQSHENAMMTYHSIWTAIRSNVKSMQSVKAEADQNAKLAQFRAVDVGSVFQKDVEAGGAGTDTRQALSPIEGATAGAWQYLFSESAKKIVPKLPAAGAAVIGGGVVLVYQISTNKVVMWPERAATFVGMLNPVAGIAANMVVAVARTAEARVQEYRKFAKNALSQNINLTSMELVEARGKSKNIAACAKRVADEKACIETRKTTQMYEHNSCSRSPVFNNDGNNTNGAPSGITGN